MTAAPQWYQVGDAGVVIGERVDGKRRDVAKFQTAADAERAVRAVNNHAMLCAVLQMMVDEFEQHRGNFRQVGAMTAARDALAKTKAGT